MCKKLITVLIGIILLVSFTISCAEESDTLIMIDIATATDEDLEEARQKIVQEQRNRLVTRIILDKDQLSLKKGGTDKLSAVIDGLPDDLSAGKLTWASSNTSVATVRDGTIRGVEEGTATITCTTVLSDGVEIFAECHVNVFVSITSISYKIKNDKALIGDTYYQDAIILPANATIKDLSYSSSNPQIATVDESGKVSVIAAGIVNIIASTTDGSEKSATYSLTIPSLKAPTTFSVTEKSGAYLEVEYFGVDSDNVTVKNSSNAIATIESDYDETEKKFSIFINPIKAGKTKVTITDGADKVNQQVVEVNIEHSAVYDAQSYPLIKYTDAYRYPSKYEGDRVSFSGRVLQVMDGWSYTILRISSRGRWDDVVYVTIDNDDITTPILEDDNVTVYGTYDGNYTYETVMGGSVTIPSVQAERINVK